MNPYTFKKRGVDSGSAQNSPFSADFKKGSWLNAIVNARLSSAVAFAFVLFAAGSVVGMSSLFASESAVDDALVLSANIVSHKQSARILGETTTQNIVEDSALEAGDPSGELLASPLGYDTSLGRWNYKFSYTVENLTNSATMTIGTYVAQSGIVSSGTVETGLILKPDMIYHISLWTTDSSGAKQNLARLELNTQKAKKISDSGSGTFKCYPTQVKSTTTPSTATPSFCIKKQDGTVQCSPKLCGVVTPDSSFSSTSPVTRSTIKPNTTIK